MTELLPRLLAALILGAACAGLWTLTLLLYRRLRDRGGAIGSTLTKIVFWTWTALFGLVALSLVVNTLGIESLQDEFDGVIAFVPRLVVVGVLAAVFGALIWGIAAPYRRWRAAQQQIGLARVVFSIWFWVVVSSLAFGGLVVCADQLGGLESLVRPIFWPVAVLAGVAIDLASRTSPAISTHGVPPPPT